MRVFCLILCLCLPGWARADVFADADVVFLGELHDNPGHHEIQARWVARLKPAALVFEMLTDGQAGRVTADVRGDKEALEAVLGWKDSGWPDFALYFPIFSAAPEAAIYGAAVPRQTARRIMREDLTDIFGDGAAAFGLTKPLPDDQQANREALQMAAHCDAMPEDMLPMMVNIQRLRDAELARQALKALRDYGAPVVVITGNGHARKDWGAPAALLSASPGLVVASLGQAEIGNALPEGGFDAIVWSPAADREDPCSGFGASSGD